MKHFFILIFLIFILVFFGLFIYSHRDSGISGIFPKPVQDVANAPSAPHIPSKPTDAKETVSTRLDQRITFNDIVIKVKEVAEDSRCPSDVQCIQAGRVVVDLDVYSVNGDLIGSSKLEEGKRLVIAGAQISLAKVEPYPLSTKEIGDGEYVFSLVLEAIE